MATNLAQVSHMLSTAGIQFRQSLEGSVEIHVETGSYKNSDGKHDLRVVIRLTQSGEYFEVFCPMAFKLDGPHVDAFLKACAILQFRTKLIQFEYDPADGEVRPTIEFPLEDATLTKRQLLRCLRGMVRLVDQYYPALERARNEGMIELRD